MTVSEFINKRRIHLKEVKALANKYLSENKRVKDTHKHKWQSDVIEHNIKELKKIISRTNKSLEDDELKRYVVSQLTQCAALSRMWSIEGESLESYLTRILDGVEKFSVFTFSPVYTIEYDFYWIPDGNIGDHHNVGLGIEPPSLYEKYLPLRIEYIQNEVVPYLTQNPKYVLHIQQLTDILDRFETSPFLTTNILLITIAESLVRELCKFVYAKQNPSKTEEEIHTYVYEKFNSLETLIQKGDWKEDYPVKMNETHMALYNNLDESAVKIDKLRERHLIAEKLIREENQKMAAVIEAALGNPQATATAVKGIELSLANIDRLMKDLVDKNAILYITVRTNLQFLLRRYKEDRNSIIHGNYFNFDKGWKTYIYLSAISRIFELIKRYDEIYQTVPAQGAG